MVDWVLPRVAVGCLSGIGDTREIDDGREVVSVNSGPTDEV
jgi:hypothetical protein